MPTREIIITVMEDEKGRLHLAARSEKLLGGLWGFPQSQPMPAGVSDAGHIGTVTHAYSHFKLIGTVQHVRVKKPAGDGWFTWDEIAGLPLSTVDHKVLALVAQKRHTDQKNAPKPDAATPKR